MAERGIIGKYSRLTEFHERLKEDVAQGQLAKLLEKYSISLDSLTSDLERLRQDEPKAAARISNLVNLVASFHKINMEEKDSGERLGKEMERSSQRLEKWSDKIDKVKNFISEHVGEISAAALGWQAWRSSWDALDTAVDTMVQTTGKLGDNWTGAAGTAAEMSSQLLGVQVSAAGLAKDMEGVTEWQRKYYRLFRTGGDAAYAVKGMAALTHSFGVDMSEMTELMEQRQKGWNQSAEETTLELAGIHSNFRKVYEGIERTGTAAQKSARIWEDDFYSVVKSAASEISESGTDMSALSKILLKAGESASKLNASYSKGKELMEDVGKLFKLETLSEVKAASDIIKEINDARSTGGTAAEEAVYKSYFRNTDIKQARQTIELMESGQLSAMMGGADIVRLMQKTGKGLSKSLSLQKEYLGNVHDVTAQVEMLKQKGIKEPVLVRDLLMSGELDDIKERMLVAGKSPEEVKKGIETALQGNEAEVKKNLEDLKSDASQTWKTVTQTAETLLKNPISTFVGSIGIFVASATLRSWQLRAEKRQVDRMKAGADAAFAASAAGSGGPGSQLSLEKRVGAAASKTLGTVGAEAGAVGRQVGALGAEAGAVTKGASTVAQTVGAEAGALGRATSGAKGILKGIRGTNLTTGAKALGVAGTVAGVGLGAYEAYEAYKAGDTKAAKRAIGSTAGSTAGGVIGGILGSFIPIPFVGTMIGAGIGSWLGGKLGEKLADSVGDAVAEEKSPADVIVPGMGDLPAMTKSAEIVVDQMKKMGLDNPETLSEAMAMARGGREYGDLHSVAGERPRLLMEGKGITGNGSLVATWQNPEAITSLLGVYTKTMPSRT